MRKYVVIEDTCTTVYDKGAMYTDSAFVLYIVLVKLSLVFTITAHQYRNY